MSTAKTQLLEAADTCRNCFRQVRRERIDPTRRGIAREYERSLERDPQTTTIGFGPSDCPPDSKGTFCECGVESPRTRVWTADDVDDERFKQLLVNAVSTLEQKGVRLRRRVTLQTALETFRAGRGVDTALTIAVKRGRPPVANGESYPTNSDENRKRGVTNSPADRSGAAD